MLFILLVALSPDHATGEPANGVELVWVETDEPAGRFLIPGDWQIRASKGKLLASLVFARGDEAGIFDRLQPLMSINPISNLSKMQNGLISRQIPTYVQAIEQDQSKTVESVQAATRDRFIGTCVRFVETRDDTPMRIHRCYLADDGNDTLLVVNFQAKESAWATAWRFGREMMNRFELGDLDNLTRNR